MMSNTTPLAICVVLLAICHISECCPKSCTCTRGGTHARCRDVSRDTMYHLNDNLAALDLSGIGMESVPLNVLKRYKKLQQLIMTNNNIDTIPNHLSSLFPKLHTLYLDSNNIEQITPLQGLQTVRFLDLSRNRIRKIIPFAFTDLPKLQILLLNSNRLTSLPRHAFSGMSSLTVLRISDNKLNKVKKETFSWQRSRLRELHLNANKIQTIPDGMFAESSQLETVLLRNNSIRYIGTNAFHAHIRELDLQFNRLRDLPLPVFQKLTNAEIKVQGNSITCSCDLIDRLANESSGPERFVIGRCFRDELGEELEESFEEYRSNNNCIASVTFWSWIWVVIVLSCIVFLLVIIAIVIVLLEMRRYRYLRFQGAKHATTV